MRLTRESKTADERDYCGTKRQPLRRGAAAVKRAANQRDRRGARQAVKAGRFADLP